MDVIASVHKQWAKKILDGEKTFEFRSARPGHVHPGDKMYLYETSKNRGRKMVVGYATLGECIPLLNEKGEYPFYGSYNFIDFYCRNILKDEEAAQKFKEYKKHQLGNFKYGCLLPYALDEESMNQIRNGEYPTPKYCADKNQDMVAKANDIIVKCDEWLRGIGFYDDGGTSMWRYALPILSVHTYDKPKQLSEFCDNRCRRVCRAPQSWMYACDAAEHRQIVTKNNTTIQKGD